MFWVRIAISIKGPTLTSNDREWLERRAYYMLSQLFWAIVADPEFMAMVAP
jgi:hypothetical protein